jgi:3',5'-cyclic AMP phosphodiesterase CpdA
MLALFLFFGATSCARRGLLRDEYPQALTLRNSPVTKLDETPRFIVYGDTRPGWLARERFAKKEAWWTWKMFVFPFYEIYWLGNGIIGGINWLRFSPDSGHREARRVRNAIYEEARRSQCDFIVNVGDIVTDGRRPKLWAHFLELNRDEVPLISDYPYLPTVGNHEHANDSTYGLPNYLDALSHAPFYVIRGADVDLFVVDSDIILDQYGYIDDDVQDRLFRKWFVSTDADDTPAWLERQLSSSNKTFKVLFMHHPPLSFGRHHNNWTHRDFGRGLLVKRQKLLRLIETHGVSLVFSGHQHMYEHTLLRRTQPGGEGMEMHFIITGGGGSPLHRRSSQEVLDTCRSNYDGEGLDAVCVRQEIIYNYCLVDVTPAELTVSIFEVPDTGEATLIDEVHIRKSDTGR